MLEAALEAGAEDMADDGESLTVYTGTSDFHAVQDALARARPRVGGRRARDGSQDDGAGRGAPTPPKLVKLLDLLEELDDVQKVYTNADIDEGSLVGA